MQFEPANYGKTTGKSNKQKNIFWRRRKMGVAVLNESPLEKKGELMVVMVMIPWLSCKGGRFLRGDAVSIFSFWGL